MEASREEIKEFFGFDEDGIENFLTKPGEAIERPVNSGQRGSGESKEKASS